MYSARKFGLRFYSDYSGSGLARPDGNCNSSVSIGSGGININVYLSASLDHIDPHPHVKEYYCRNTWVFELGMMAMSPYYYYGNYNYLDESRGYDSGEIITSRSTLDFSAYSSQGNIQFWILLEVDYVADPIWAYKYRKYFNPGTHSLAQYAGEKIFDYGIRWILEAKCTIAPDMGGSGWDSVSASGHIGDYHINYLTRFSPDEVNFKWDGDPDPMH